MAQGKTKAGKGRRASAKAVARLASAIALHQRGQLNEAEEVYLAVLAADHDNADALPYLRPYARRLVGVDLSPKMLAQAAKRALYDESVAAELGSFLRASPGGFDVVASSDTLVYFGDLGEVLAAARRSLRPGGRLVFTLEHEANEAQAPAGYRIHPHGRYSHTESYVRSTLADAGFELLELEKANLRREGAAYVNGLVVAACAAGGAGSDASSSRN